MALQLAASQYFRDYSRRSHPLCLYNDAQEQKRAHDLQPAMALLVRAANDHFDPLVDHRRLGHLPDAKVNERLGHRANEQTQEDPYVLWLLYLFCCPVRRVHGNLGAHHQHEPKRSFRTRLVASLCQLVVHRGCHGLPRVQTQVVPLFRLRLGSKEAFAELLRARHQRVDKAGSQIVRSERICARCH